MAFPVPIVAAIMILHRRWDSDGWACDIRLAADNTVFRAGDAYIGMVPSWGMGLTRLPRYVDVVERWTSSCS